ILHWHTPSAPLRIKPDGVEPFRQLRDARLLLSGQLQGTSPSIEHQADHPALDLSCDRHSSSGANVDGFGRLYCHRCLVAQFQGVELEIAEFQLLLNHLAIRKRDLNVCTQFPVFALSNWSNTGTEIDHTVPDEHVRRSLFIDRGEDTEMGHHK